jgi:flotillin
MIETPFAGLGVGVAAVALIVVLAIVLFKAMWKVAEPNEALIISGMRSRGKAAEGVGESMGFKIVTGHGTFVIPGVQVARRLSLDAQEAPLTVSCVTRQGIKTTIEAVVIYKVGDDFASIANAARRFLDQQDKMNPRIQNVFEGHLRAICGLLTLEDLIRDRDKLTAATREAAGVEMQKLGLVIDSLQIKGIADPSGYIDNLAQPHVMEAQKTARIAKANADREATEREQEAIVAKAAAMRDSQVKQAAYTADVEKAKAESAQAGPLAEAQARQEVIIQETRIQQLEAARKEQELEVSVRKPADAAAYQTRTVAAGQRDADIAAAEARAKQVELNATAQAASTRLVGEADAAAIQAKGNAEASITKNRLLAEAEGLQARARALAENQEAVIGQQLADKWPAIVEASAKAFGSIDQLIVLNGADGITDILAKVVAQGATGIATARALIDKASGKGARDEVASSNGERRP